MSTNLRTKTYDCKSFVKEFSPIGEKYQLVLNGGRAALDSLGIEIMTNANGYYMYYIPGLSTQMKAHIPTDVLCRTPKLEWNGESDTATLTVIGERGLLNGDVVLGDTSEAYVMPRDATCRFVYEPLDVALAYGLPFRAGFKWDLTVQAANLSTFALITAVAVQDVSDPTKLVDPSPTTLDIILKNLGYDPDNISKMAICNIWEGGALTEPQRGAIFQYLNAGNASGDPYSNGGGLPTKEYVKRILRGQTSYRFWMPHISVTLRFKQLPNNTTYVPFAGRWFDVGDENGPPAWTNAPTHYSFNGQQLDQLKFKYWSTGPQVEFTGDQWIVEQQWSGFIDHDSELLEDSPLP